MKPGEMSPPEYVRHTEEQLREIGLLSARIARRRADEDYAAVVEVVRAGGEAVVVAGTMRQAQNVYAAALAKTRG